MSVESIIARGRARMAEMFEKRGQWAVIYNPVETTGTLQSVSTAWTEAGAAYVSFSQDAAVRLASYGAGELPAGRREMQFVAPFDLLAERQGVDVTSGPEGGTKWRVLFVDRSDRIIVRALVEPYSGDFA